MQLGRPGYNLAVVIRGGLRGRFSPDGHGEPQNGGVSIQSSKSRPTARRPGCCTADRREGVTVAICKLLPFIGRSEA